jgi:hypothetical protein
MNNIFDEFNKSQFVFDRSPTDIFVLPNDLNSVLLQPNELAVASTFNIKIEKLYENFLYLYGLCNIAGFNIPNKFVGWVGLSGMPHIKSNLFTYSENLTASPAWGNNNITVTHPYALNPANGYDVFNLNSGTTTSSHSLSSNFITIENNVYYTFSAYLKFVDKANVQLGFSPNGFSSACYANFNIQLGTITQTGADCTSYIEFVGNNWYRCSITARATSSSSTQSPGIIFAQNGTSTYLPVYTGADSNLYSWGAQLEKGATIGMYQSPTGPYVKTAGAAVNPPPNIAAFLRDQTQLFGPVVPLSSAVSFVTGGDFYKNLNESNQSCSFKTSRFDSPVIVASSRNNFTILGLDLGYNPVLVKTQSLIDPLSGSLNFQNITGIASDGDRILFVADSTLNNVYSYDIYDTISDDFVKRQRCFLLNYIGGKGTTYDKFKFNTTGQLLFTGSELIVEDTGNRCFKIYDRNLNWHNTVFLKTLFESAGAFSALAYRPASRTIYACAAKTLYILNYGTDFNIVLTNSYDYSSIFATDESIIDIRFASYEDSIFYIFTNKAIYKKWITEPEKNIGISPQSLFGGNTIKWGTLTSNTSADSLYVYNTNSSLSSSNIAVFNDDLNLISILNNQSLNIYDKTDIIIDRDEYNQAWIYNKSFKKLMYNIILLISNIGYRFYEGEGANQAPLYVNRLYNKFFVDDIPVDINTYANVCVNENFQAAALNRCLEKIYTYEKNILDNIVDQANVRANLLPTTFRGNNKMFDFIVYIGGAGITVNPVEAKLYSNTDKFVSGQFKITGIAPYTDGEGITII